MLSQIAHWLAAQPASEALQAASWAVPSIQCVHILALAVILASMAMMDAKVLMARGPTLSGPELDRRFLRWVWPSLVIMALSGALLIVAEPARSLANPVFQWKMILLVGAVVTSLGLVWGMGGGELADLPSGRRAVLRVLAGVSLLLWLAVAVAGRWIAYYVQM